ncbi:conserved Plasmodium protein, unknown function [Plasmodium relictum]|uniref:WIBG Mago-binding domain-containing protein n=1 Tax=Plasmodium relictum TaxID=85471 RepID=A0A1J1H7M7_PLARL|nr:conserved Plasmodium protein, unknown function [Plasmodium relictum]CRH00667.1 conserved Plasmodium protein, unknown function [Plasmodium relictum]
MKNENFRESKLKNTLSNSFEKDNSSEDYIKEVLTPLGDVYIINEKTNEKFIKGTQRSDGTFRKNIRVRTDYMPQEENCVYKVKGKLLEEQDRSKNININTEEENKVHKKKIPGWNPVNEHENENISNIKKKKKKKKKKKILNNQESVN